MISYDRYTDRQIQYKTVTLPPYTPYIPSPWKFVPLTPPSSPLIPPSSPPSSPAVYHLNLEIVLASVCRTYRRRG